MNRLLFSISILLTLNTFGQVAPPQNPQPTPPPSALNFIVAIQMGTDTLKSGEVTVKLTEEAMMEMKQAMASPDYTVLLTPRGSCEPLNLLKIAPDSFIIKGQKGYTPAGIFDYVVFVKQRRPMMPVRPRPPGRSTTSGSTISKYTRISATTIIVILKALLVR